MLTSTNPFLSPNATIFNPFQIKTYFYPDHLKLLIFSYLNGCELFHKIAVTSKATRNQLPVSGLLDQVRVITFKVQNNDSPTLLPVDSFRYGLQLATSIQVYVTLQNLNQAITVLNLMRVAKRKTRFNLILLCSVKKHSPKLIMIFIVPI